MRQARPNRPPVIQRMLIEVIDTPDIKAGKTMEKKVITVQKPMMSSISSRPAFFHPQKNG